MMVFRNTALTGGLVADMLSQSVLQLQLELSWNSLYAIPPIWNQCGAWSVLVRISFRMCFSLSENPVCNAPWLCDSAVAVYSECRTVPLQLS